MHAHTAPARLGAVGACWVLTLYAHECLLRDGDSVPDARVPKALGLEKRFAFFTFNNIRRAHAANPELPMCLLTSMGNGTLSALLSEYRSQAPLLAMSAGGIDWLSALHVVTIPGCAIPAAPDAAVRAHVAGKRQQRSSASEGARDDALGQALAHWDATASHAGGAGDVATWPSPVLQPGPPAAAHLLSARRGPNRCSLCALAAAHLQAHAEIPRALRQKSASGRYSRLLKISALAQTPFNSTLLLDADASLCARALEATLGVADALAESSAALSVRLIGNHLRRGSNVSQMCDNRCSRPPSLAEDTRAHMRCLSRCLNAAPRAACSANTGVFVVRRGAAAAQVSAAWWWKYLQGLSERAATASGARLTTPGAARISALLYRDQTAFGDRVPARGQHEHDASGAACARIANLPLNMHLGRPRPLSQGQQLVSGRPIAVHGCRAFEADGSCALHRACCEQRAASCMGGSSGSAAPALGAGASRARQRQPLAVAQ